MSNSKSSVVVVLLTLCLPGCGAQDDPPVDAWVYPLDPLGGELSQVTLRHLDHHGEEGLIGRYASVWNCASDEGGEKVQLTLGGLKLSGRMCRMTRRASAGPDGSLLHITPPDSDTDGADAFAEVMVYHHITTIAQRFRTRLGAPEPEQPLKVIVNMQGYADMLGRWVGVPNAAYAPPSAQQELRQLVDIDVLQGEEAILFGYNNMLPQLGQVDFAYDASIIYHEYTHSMVGERLLDPVEDALGLDNTSRAVNEALADYFATSTLGTPRVASYILGDGARDLTQLRRCPDDLVGESHRDGQILSGALWSMRERLGVDVADRVVWNALQTFDRKSTLSDATQAILAEAQRQAPQIPVQDIFEAHGLVGCVRFKEHRDFSADAGALYQPEVPGTLTAPAPFKEVGAPAPVQQWVTLDRNARALTIKYAAISGTVLGIGGAAADVAVAVRPGDRPIHHDYRGGKATMDATVVPGASQPGSSVRQVVLAGRCLSQGHLVFQLVNHGEPAALLSSLRVTQSDEPPPAAVFRCD